MYNDRVISNLTLAAVMWKYNDIVMHDSIMTLLSQCWAGPVTLWEEVALGALAPVHAIVVSAVEDQGVQ